MKRKVISALTVVMALCLVFTVYALNKTNVSPKHAAGADCCAKKDSCPMKNADAIADKASCCDKGDDCPMKSNAGKSEGKDCCTKSDSCPMKKSDDKQTSTAASVDMTNVTVANGESCCEKRADCCEGKHS